MGVKKTTKQFKKEVSGGIIQGDRQILEGKEIDILIPELSLGFEFNGTYWHSDKFKPRGYHQNKTELAASKGICLIHISEKRWDKMNLSIKSMITNKIRSAA